MPDRGRLRWRLAEDDGGQPTLFPEEALVERHVGIGEYGGLEFLHVNAKQVINPVPAASRMPFRYTVNAYRGCSHACVYCAGGDSEVLMADGRTKPLRDVAPGDRVVGTRREGCHRRYVETEVRDHWDTRRHAYRTVLDDGTELITSGDHRFLTNRGWKHVIGTELGRLRRPFLTPANSLIGPGRFPLMPGHEWADSPVRKVESITALGIVMPMYDLTTGTGDFVLNGVISHNCFARPTHEYLGLNAAEDFERKLVVKVNAVERVRAELRSPKWGGDLIAMGTNTDPYQHAEGKYHLTQGIVRALSDAANPFSILTKSTLILRDLQLLARAATRTDVRCALSIGTLDESVWKSTEPGTPPPRRRVEAVRRLNQAGIPTGVLIAPIIPGMSDAPGPLSEVTEACLAAGATDVTPLPLHLRPGVKEVFLRSLEASDPELAGRLRARYGRRSYLSGNEQHRMTRPVWDVVRRRRGDDGHDG